MKTYEYKIATWAPGKLPFVEWLNGHGAQGWHLSTMYDRTTRRMSRAHVCVFARGKTDG